MLDGFDNIVKLIVEFEDFDPREKNGYKYFEIDFDKPVDKVSFTKKETSVVDKYVLEISCWKEEHLTTLYNVDGLCFKGN